MDDKMLEKLVKLTISYVPETGKLYWRERDSLCIKELGMDTSTVKHFNNTFAGNEIINKANTGYIQICFKFRNDVISEDITLLGHRVAWFIYYGEWPDLLDHIDGDRCNNKISNLRKVTHSENMYNIKNRSDSSSGVTGVSFKKDKGKWKAYYTKGGKQVHLGYFNNFDDACNARKNWEISSKIMFRESVTEDELV